MVKAWGFAKCNRNAICHNGEEEVESHFNGTRYIYHTYIPVYLYGRKVSGALMLILYIPIKLSTKSRKDIFI